MEQLFSAFCHISIYDEKGFGLVPQMIETSYPLILWAPPGARWNEYYDRGICSVSPEELVNYVEKGFVQIVGREKWLLDEQYRHKYADNQPFAKWHENFDGALKSIWRDQQSMPEHERSVRIAPDEDGWQWADALLQAEPDRIDRIWERIMKGQIPQYSLKKIRAQGYGEKDKYKAVRQVLHDVRDHRKAIYDAQANIPFLLYESEVKFFRFLERSGSIKLNLKRETKTRAISPQFTEEVHRLLERFKHPEKVYSLASFVGSETHKDLAKWLHSTAHLAEQYSKQDLKKFMVGQLKRDIERGLQPENAWNILGPSLVEKGATVGSVITGIASLFFSGLVFDLSTAITLTGITMSAVPVISGISQRLGIIKPNYSGPQWPYLLRFDRTPTKWDIREVTVILEVLSGVINED